MNVDKECWSGRADKAFRMCEKDPVLTDVDHFGTQPDSELFMHLPDNEVLKPRYIRSCGFAGGIYQHQWL